MNESELTEVARNARADGKRLFHAAETLHNIGLFLLGLLALLGLIVAGTLMNRELVPGGFLVIVATLVVCWFLYLNLKLATNLSKVLVHTMFAQVGTLEELTRRRTPDRT